jgi:hypothetical protein
LQAILGGLDVQIQNYDDVLALDNKWEKAHFSFACYLDQLYTDAKQREVNTPSCRFAMVIAVQLLLVSDEASSFFCQFIPGVMHLSASHRQVV